MAKLCPPRCRQYQVSGGSNKANGDNLLPSQEQMFDRETAKRNLCLAGEAQAIKYPIMTAYFTTITPVGTSDRAKATVVAFL